MHAPYSVKKAKVTRDTTKKAAITACPGTTCSAPFAPRWPACTNAGAKAGFRNAMLMTGKASITGIGIQSRNAILSS